ncbi:MAG TPA: metallopeptidase family protein [Gemmatimonadales bacterium]|nr:metallopeptidase family protein [Gemmatimonadales bacterium]
MQLRDFRQLVDRLAKDVPAKYLDGIIGIEVSPKTVPDPVREGVYTLGECIPVETGGETVPSRVVLYYGSFQALARERPGFDWREEAWETLLHELRHHLEWRANAAELEAYDWAAEQNFRRADGESFDPLFHLSGERADEGVYRVEDDVFWDVVVRRPPPEIEIPWHGRRYRVAVPSVEPPLYLDVAGLEPEPAGQVIVVVRRKPGVRDLFRRPGTPKEYRVVARRVD